MLGHAILPTEWFRKGSELDFEYENPFPLGHVVRFTLGIDRSGEYTSKCHLQPMAAGRKNILEEKLTLRNL